MRSRATIMGLTFILLAGLASLFIGKRFLQQQKEVIELSTHHQQQHIEKHIQYFNSDIGLLLYYIRFTLINQPGPLAGISIGQRDVNPSIQRVTIRNLENQVYDTDLNNPSNLLLGNMDLGFVIIYLFPLLIIAFTYNLLSEEKEGGTWDMIRLHAASPTKILWQKMVMRLCVVFAAAFLLMVLAVIILSVPLNDALLAIAALFSFYLLFWFGLSYWLVSWKKNSSFNAVCLLALWVLLTILAPAMVNSFISNAYPVPEALQTAIRQRQGFHEKWDMDKKVTLDKFYEHYPQYRKYPLPDKQFSWLWYYAMQQMGDDESAKESQSLKEKLWKREEVSSEIAMILPVLHVQLALNNLAGTGLQNHLQFLNSTKCFHEQMRLYFYEKIFEGRPVNSVDWKNIKPKYFSTQQDVRWLPLLSPLLMITAVLFWLARYNFDKPTGTKADPIH
jgi:ABC-2 type transport system permease protein